MGTRLTHPGFQNQTQFWCQFTTLDTSDGDRLPNPHLTHPVRLFLIAHHDGLQPTQHEVV